MTRTVSSVTVSAAALGDLILAVHTAAEQRGFALHRRWRYDNVVGIGTARLRDLALPVARTKHGGTAPVAAITVITHNRISVDVLFEVDADQARALFFCATATSGTQWDQERSWGCFLADATSAALDDLDVGPTLSCTRSEEPEQ
ncbi:hypothetical protein ACWEKT_26565 [Nocardia takedensis]